MITAALLVVVIVKQDAIERCSSGSKPRLIFHHQHNKSIPDQTGEEEVRVEGRTKGDGI
jgi:hypothetical protein